MPLWKIALDSFFLSIQTCTQWTMEDTLHCTTRPTGCELMVMHCISYINIIYPTVTGDTLIAFVPPSLSLLRHAYRAIQCKNPARKRDKPCFKLIKRSTTIRIWVSSTTTITQSTQNASLVCINPTFIYAARGMQTMPSSTIFFGVIKNKQQ